MNTTTLAKLIDVSPDTVRRWTSDYRAFLSPTGSPVRGQTRVLTANDMAVLSYIATLRQSGEAHDQITNRLEDLQRGDWQELPAVPSDWLTEHETTALEAMSRAREVVTIAQLQTELKHAEQQLQKEITRADLLQTNLETLRAEKATADDNLHRFEVELERSRGEIKRLESQIAGYNIAYGFGRDRPVSVAVIILIALLTGAALVAIAFVLARVLL